MAQQKGIISPKRTTISVVRRTLLPPAVGSAVPQHAYSIVFTTRAEVKSSAGQSDWSRVEIDGKKATHTFTIRFTTLDFDARDRVRDATGDLYQILKVENVDLRRREMKIYCSAQGDEDAPASR